MKKALITLLLIGNVLGTTVCFASDNEMIEKGNLGVTEKVEIFDEVKEKRLDEEKTVLREKDKNLKATSKINKIGFSKQVNGYYCGPATLYNMVVGYDIANFGKYDTYITDRNHPNGKRLMTQSDYATVLGTTTNGTGFGDRFKNGINSFIPNNNYVIKQGNQYSEVNWRKEVKNSVIYTINKDNGTRRKNYPVLINQHKEKNTVNADIHDVYKGAASRHFYTVYGYGANGDKVYVADSKKEAPSSIYTDTVKVANACKARGIIW